MIFAITIHGHPQASQASHSALKFAQATLAAGHEIHRVFFYHDAVHQADEIAVSPQDEDSLHEQWSAFARTSGVELTVCIAAGLKRGVLNEEERRRYDRSAANAGQEFQIVGLGQLIEAAISADRLITFAA